VPFYIYLLYITNIFNFLVNSSSPSNLCVPKSINIFICIIIIISFYICFLYIFCKFHINYIAFKCIISLSSLHICDGNIYISLTLLDKILDIFFILIWLQSSLQEPFLGDFPNNLTSSIIIIPSCLYLLLILVISSRRGQSFCPLQYHLTTNVHLKKI
jgi:hypothetical protein